MSEQQATTPDGAAEARQALYQMSQAYWISRAVQVAAELGIADLLGAGPKRAEALAEATGTIPSHLYRMMRALASVGVFIEGEDGTFSLTAMSECMRSDAVASARPMLRYLGRKWEWEAWARFPECIKTGEAPLPKIFGGDIFRYFADHPEDGKIFNDAMTGMSESANGAIIKAYDFAPFRTIADIGGGNGSLIAAILRASPDARGVLFDLDRMVADARARLAEWGVSERCETVAGSFLESVPTGADVYTIKQCIHDWDDAHALTILRNIRRCMPETSRLLIIDPVLPPVGVPHFSKLLDLEMMVGSNEGRERTASEFQTLLEQARFKLARVVPTESFLGIVEAFPA